MPAVAKHQQPERFMDKVSPEPNSGCWLWLGAVKNNGYGVIGMGGKIHHAHRVSYEREHGPIPAGLSIDHLCRTRSCVNPQHLEAVSQGENVRRGECGSVNAARQTAKAECPQGHPYSGNNLIINRAGARECRTCNCAKTQRYKARRADCRA
jgi:hypothetical protein